MEKNSNFLKGCKSHLEKLLAQKDKMFWEDGIMKLPENGSEQWSKMVNMLFNKVLDENEKCVFYFYLKTKGTFLPTQQLLL